MSYSRLASYLECPGCVLERTQKKRPKEPKHFTPVRQATLFGKGEPDARLVGTLLHVLVNFLHDSGGLLAKEQQEALLADPGVLTSFIRHEVLTLLQKAGKLNLAMFFDELRLNGETLYTTLIAPMLRYQHDFASTGAVVFATSERFQFKLLSTRNTFAGHPDWGGYVALVGEFDQIRLRNDIPAIMEFKKGLGRKNAWPSSLIAPLAEQVGGNGRLNAPSSSTLPSILHAMQLMIYWMAFQTRWDVLEKVAEVKGMVEDIRMPLHQQLDLIIYNLHDGCQYQLQPTNHQEALIALTNCIFHLNWAMKSGYAWHSPEHNCSKKQLVELPNRPVQVGYTTLSAQECYLLARDAFDRFKDTVRWRRVTASEENRMARDNTAKEKY